MRLAGGVRAIAILEATKGALVVVAGFAMLATFHAGTQQVAEELVGHLHLNPAKGTPRIFTRLVNDLFNQQLWLLAVFAGVYSAARFIEAYGLWRGRRWAEWFAVASGGIYVPFEIYELVRGVTGVKLATLFVNVVIVAYMAFVLWESKRGRRE
ncbi:MAG TPA: DUF2127 domain-containing protein [Burkholderiales bacterium]|jgi:uncharacterized membrane protein (DUF2068 family)